jgi:hypothetical protein
MVASQEQPIGDDIRNGVIATLRKATHENTPFASKYGYNFQLQRGEYYFNNEELLGFEFAEQIGESEFAYDLLLDLSGDLTADAVGEVKYWRASTLNSRQSSIINQIEGYQQSGRHVIIEFGETASAPVTVSQLNNLHTEMIDRGIDVQSITLRLIKRTGEIIDISG